MEVNLTVKTIGFKNCQIKKKKKKQFTVIIEIYQIVSFRQKKKKIIRNYNNERKLTLYD